MDLEHQMSKFNKLHHFFIIIIMSKSLLESLFDSFFFLFLVSISNEKMRYTQFYERKKRVEEEQKDFYFISREPGHQGKWLYSFFFLSFSR